MIEIEVSAGNFKRAADLPGQWSIKTVSSTNYTITDIDGYDAIFVTTGASDRTILLSTAAYNSGRKLVIIKVDDGAGKVIVDGEGTEKIVINGIEYETIDLINIGDRLDIICDGIHWWSFNLTNLDNISDGTIYKKVANVDSNHQITTASIKNSNVTVAKMASNSINSAQYVDGSIDSVHLASNIITNAKIANNSINTQKLIKTSSYNNYVLVQNTEWLIPAGFWVITISDAESGVKFGIYDGGTWRDNNVNFGGGVIYSDGINMRLINRNVATTYARARLIN